MALDPTHSEAYFRRSVRKFFVDNLVTVDNVYIDFSKIYKTPEDDSITEWIRFHFNGLSADGTMFIGRVAAYLFTRGDTGSGLAVLRDKLQNYLVDLNMPDGIRRVPLYGASLLTPIGGMILTTGNESTEEYADDDTLYKFVNLYFRYAIT